MYQLFHNISDFQIMYFHQYAHAFFFSNLLKGISVVLELFFPILWQVVEGGEMESESHEEAGDEEIESGAAGNESDMDLDLLAESDSDSEESQVQHLNF